MSLYLKMILPILHFEQCVFSMTISIAVIGGGVIGLSSALCLAKNISNCHLTVIAEDYFPTRKGITSVHGFGNVGLRRDESNHPKSVEWLQITHNYCSKMHPTKAESAGIRPVDLLLLYHEEGKEGLNAVLSERARNLQKLVPVTKQQANVEHLSNNEALKTLFPPLNPRSELSIFGMPTYNIDSSLYLPWLRNQLISLQNSSGEQRVTFQTRKITALDEISDDFDIVVNCAGINGGLISNDSTVFPIRGQYISIEKVSSVNKAIAGRETVVFPRVNDIVLGGVYQKGRSDTEVDPDDTESIMRRCETLVPAVKGAKVLRIDVGIRPARYGGARLELEWWPRDPRNKSDFRKSPNTCPVIHNYGHGGDGFAVHWGCAQDVAKLAIEALSEKSKL